MSTNQPKLTEQDKADIRSYVNSTDSSDSKRERRKECAELYDVNIQTIAAITAWTTIRANQALKTTTQESLPQTGEHVEYDNEIKNKWRVQWKAFLESKTTQKQRASMKVICLPGKKCLEAEMYIQMGFAPENILGVEGGDKKAVQEFVENAGKLGIEMYIGDLDTYWKQSNDRFDVASYDFLGPSCKKYEEIVANTLLTERGFMLLNMMMKRENRTAQFNLQGWRAFNGKELDSILQEEGSDFHEVTYDFRKAIHERLSSSQSQIEERVPVKDVRSTALIIMYGQYIGLNRGENSLYVEDIHQLLQSGDRNYHISQNAFDNITKLVSLSLKSMMVGEDRADSVGLHLRGLIAAAWQRIALINEFEQYRYVSHVGKASSPFHSIFMQIHHPYDAYHRMRHTTEFMIKGAKHAVANPDETKMGMLVRDKNMAKKQCGAPARPSDILFLQTENGKTIAQIQLKQLQRDVDKYAELAATDVKPKIMIGSLIPEIKDIT